MAGAAIGSAVGYGIGNVVAGQLNPKFNPWYRPQWVTVGPYGIQGWNYLNPMPNIFGSAVRRGLARECKCWCCLSDAK